MTEYTKQLDHSGVKGERIAKRLAELSKIGAMESGGVTRVGYSEEEKQAKGLVARWMREAGLTVTTDGAGNVFGRLNGKTDGPAIMSGSHLDSVPNGGNFDGTLGVLTALEVAEAWKETGYTPPMPYEVVVFSDEEGSRFKSGLTGSQAFMGKLTSEQLDQLIDHNGDGFDTVIENYGSSRERYLIPQSEQKNIGLFVEVHIEQGTVLEERDQPVGIVNGIAGPAWLEVVFKGEAGHAGNTPMEKRKDPVIAASIFASEVEKVPRKVSKTAVATIGKMDVAPNGVNVIAQEVKLMVDIRDIHETPRDEVLDLVCEAAERIASARGIGVTMSVETRITPLPIEEDMQGKAATTIREMGLEPVYIPSGAGHDAMILGEKYPVSMLFVRSKDGISHNPKEWTTLTDSVYATHVLKKFIENNMSE
jgi:allantoate deiminase